MTDNAEEDFDTTDLVRFTSFNQISKVETSSYSVSEGSKSFPGGLITVRRTVRQVQEEIEVMEVTPQKPSKTAVQKAGTLGGRLLKSLFDTSPAEVVGNEAKLKAKQAKQREKEGMAKSSSGKSSTSSGSGGGAPYVIKSVSPPPPRNPVDPVEFGGYEEPLCSPLYPVARTNHQRHQTYSAGDNFRTPGIRQYPKPQEKSSTYSKYSLEKDSPGRSSRTTSTEASSHSNNMESDFDMSTDSTGERTSRRRERNQQALIDRLHAEALKMKLEKAEEEMQKLRMEVHTQADPQKPIQLDTYRSDTASNPQSSVDEGDRRGISRINSLDDGGNYGRQEENIPHGLLGRPESAPLPPRIFAADEQDIRNLHEGKDIGPSHWVDYNPELEILDETPMQVDDAWRSAQMYTFLQDAAAVNTVSGNGIQKQKKYEKKVEFAFQKQEQQSRTHSRVPSLVESPTNFQQEQQRYPRSRTQSTAEDVSSSLQLHQHQDLRYAQSRPHSRTGDSPTAMQQQHEVHSVEQIRSVETLSSSTSAMQQQRVMQRTKSVESNSSNKSNPSPKSSPPYVSARTRSNTTIAERISRTHNVLNVQQSQPLPHSEPHRQTQPHSEPHRQTQPLSEPHRQTQSVAQLEQHRLSQPLQFQTEIHRQPEQPMYQPEHHRQEHSVSQPENYNHRHPQSMPEPEYNRHPPFMSQAEQHRQQQSLPQMQFENRRPQQILPQNEHHRDQHSVPQLEQQRSQQSAPLTPEHHRSGSLTFPTLPQLTLQINPSSHDNDDMVISTPSSPSLHLSPTSSGLITPTGMPPPTAFQSEAERAAYQHQKTMEKLFKSRRNREAMLLNNRSRPVSGGYS